MLITGMGVMQVPLLKEHIVAIETRLLAQAPSGTTPPQVFLIPTTDFVAESGPEGGIFVSLGTLRGLHSEDAMAFVVAHELGHVELGHTSTRDTAHGWAHSLRILALSGLRMTSHSSLQANSWKDLGQAPVRDAVITSEVGDLADDVLFPGWNRDQERDADQYALKLMVKAGYSPAGADEVFEKLEAIEAAHEQELERLKAASQATEATFAPKSIQDIVDYGTAQMTSHVKAGLAELSAQRFNTHGSSSDRHALVAASIDKNYADATMDV